MQQMEEQRVNSDNMRIYNLVRSIPADAVSVISGGPLRGFSNVNPQIRWELLTNIFGPVGRNFRVEQKARWTEALPTGETAVFCEVNLFYRENGTEEWSSPVFGQGGSMLIRRTMEWVDGVQKAVLHIDDEAYKKAYTDAVSVACKALGIAADVYYKQDETKYGTFRQDISNAQAQEQAASGQQASSQQWPWNPSFKEIKPGAPNWKASVTQVSKMAENSPEEILSRISAKFNITRENFDELLRVANHRIAA